MGSIYLNTAAINAAVNSTGAKGSAAGDTLAEQKAVVSYINRHGGVACGRSLQLVAYEWNEANAYNTEYQAACSDWTQDHKVVAGTGPVVSAAAGGEVLISCLANRQTLAVGASYDMGAEDLFNKYAPYYYAPASLAMGQVGRIYAEGLASQGYFQRGPRVGIVAYEGHEFDIALNSGLLPALRRIGVTPKDVARVSEPSGLSDEGRLVSDTQGVELRFASEHIDHVLFLDGNSSVSFFFIKQAQNQGYTPRYGLSTLSVPSFLEQNYGPAQLGNALAVGWTPTSDVDTSRLPQHPAVRLCEAIMKAAGLEANVETDLALQLSYCSEFFFLKAALDAAPALTPQGIASAVANLQNFEVSAAYGSGPDTFTSAKRWGAATYRTLAYATSCSCFAYTSDNIPVS